MEDFLDHVRDTLRKPRPARIAIAVLCVLVITVAFEAGEAVGYHRASFARELDQGYGRSFGRGLRYGFPGPGMPNMHGAFGRIVSVSGNSLTIAQQSGPDMQVNLANDTLVRDQQQDIATSSLSVGAYVVVFGEPGQGALDAKLIRIVPTPAGATSAPSR